MFIPVTPQGHVPVDAQGQILSVDSPLSDVVVRVAKSPEVWACSASAAKVQDIASAQGGRLETARAFVTQSHQNRIVTRAIALINFRMRYRFDPETGDPLDFPATGVVGHNPQGSNQWFPRLDPAVICRVHHPDEDCILVGRNAVRNSPFYSLVAGYVDAGESLEEACVREVREETGFNTHSVRYLTSQPWAISGSIMIGFAAIAQTEQEFARDGELSDVRWIEKGEVNSLPLAPGGTIAHEMIMGWVNQ